MILRDVRRYLKQREQASLKDMALHLNADEEAVKGMLDLLIRRGEVSLANSTSACQSSCGSCSVNSNVYFWGQQSQCHSAVITPDWE